MLPRLPHGRRRLARPGLGLLAVAALLAACSSAPPQPGGPVSRAEPRPAEPRPATRPYGGAPAVPLPTNPRGGYYGDDGPPDSPPPGLELTPDAVPRPEPLLARNGRPYVVFGRTYTPMTQLAPYRERGMASWYGRKFHGQSTASGERYDMFGMSAAHPTLPIPSYVRVTNLRNRRSVVVRVNDRGPFLQGRLIDLSYTAALKLGYAQHGSTDVEVELVQPDETPAFQILQASAEGGAQPQPQPQPQPVSAAAPVAPAPAGAPVQPAAPVAPADDEPTRLVVETLAAQPPVTVPPVSASVPAAAPVWPAAGGPPAGRARGSRAEAARPVVAAGSFLQLGAFVSRTNAEAARSRIAALLDGLPIELVDERGLFKLLAGPFGARDAAQLAERIGQATGSRPFVVPR